MPRFSRLLAAAAAVALAGCGAQTDLPGPRSTPEGNLRYGDLTFEPCSLSAPGGTTLAAQCATLAVPENHDEPGGMPGGP